MSCVWFDFYSDDVEVKEIIISHRSSEMTFELNILPNIKYQSMSLMLAIPQMNKKNYIDTSLNINHVLFVSFY